MENLWSLGWFWLTLAVIVLAALIWIWARIGRGVGSSNFAKKEYDLEILKGRYTRGEISESEFRKKRRELTGKRRHR